MGPAAFNSESDSPIAHLVESENYQIRELKKIKLGNEKNDTPTMGDASIFTSVRMPMFCWQFFNSPFK
jgi:hypothetical protein